MLVCKGKNPAHGRGRGPDPTQVRSRGGRVCDGTGRPAPTGRTARGSLRPSREGCRASGTRPVNGRRGCRGPDGHTSRGHGPRRTPAPCMPGGSSSRHRRPHRRAPAAQPWWPHRLGAGLGHSAPTVFSPTSVSLTASSLQASDRRAISAWAASSSWSRCRPATPGLVAAEADQRAVLGGLLDTHERGPVDLLRRTRPRRSWPPGGPTATRSRTSATGSQHPLRTPPPGLRASVLPVHVHLCYTRLQEGQYESTSQWLSTGCSKPASSMHWSPSGRHGSNRGPMGFRAVAALTRSTPSSTSPGVRTQAAVGARRGPGRGVPYNDRIDHDRLLGYLGSFPAREWTPGGLRPG